MIYQEHTAALTQICALTYICLAV